jgi:translocation and assembly module TamA
VNVTPDIKKNQQLTVPIKTEIKVRKRNQYSVGLGYGTDTGIRGSLGYDRRHIRENGEHMKFFLRASEIQTHLEAKYVIPGKNPVTDEYNISALIGSEKIADGRVRSLKAGINQITVLSNEWRQTLSLSLLRASSTPFQQQTFVTTLLYPSADWLHIKSDNQLNPNRGHRINFHIQGAPAILFSNVSFAQAQLDVKKIQPLSRVNRLVIRGAFGYTASNDFDRLPLTMRYYTGGARSVRGFGYQEIGRPLGQKTLLVGSLEFQQRIVENWYITAFTDTANATRQITKKIKMKTGVGLGILWASPVGAVELSVAKAVSERDNPTRIQFSMGPIL